MVLTMSRAGGAEESGVADLVKALAARGIEFTSIDTERSSLEDIFVDLVGKDPARVREGVPA